MAQASSGSLLTVSGNVADGGYLLTVAGSGSTAISGGLSGGSGLTMSSAGLLTLSGSNTYTGTTTVNNGILALAFSAAVAPANNIINNAANSSGLRSAAAPWRSGATSAWPIASNSTA